MSAPEGEETIFAEALRLPPEERAAYLAQATHGNSELRRRVEALLGSYQTGDFLEHAAAPQLRQTRHISVPLTEKPGDTIGRYKLLQQIGEGGCGVVYMAEQAEPVRRRVALKIIKLGMDTKSVIARFEAERQALALMDHPNIAKVFDAGATEAGRPYFVMELVRGMKITEYCDEAKLSTHARLELFIQVCQAIQHAHQKGIIHRDIKPSNILVTVNDGVPVPKVIDFGIAKATSGQQLTDKTLFTAFEQFIGTPAYMSPEQAVLTSLDIDTRSDIYALGVLLYELLTGKTPFDAQELLSIGLDEMRRTIREQEPPRPSTRLSTLPGQELSTTAQRRGLEAPKLVSELRGDLDWIVMKALEKDRARRYETANSLASDIERHLNHEPVVACPPSRLYRLKKMVRRNKLAFAAGGAVAMALVIGIVASTWQAARARRAEQAAKAEKDSAEAVLNFFRGKVLAAGRPEGMGGGVGKDVTLRQAIDAAESKIAKAFQDRPLVEAAIRKTLGESYLYLGEPVLAIQQLERALALRRQRLGLEHLGTVVTMNILGEAYRDAGRLHQSLPLYEETLKLFEESLKLKKAKLGPEHLDTLPSMNNIALVYAAVGKFDQALPLFEETLKLAKAKLGPENHNTLKTMNNLARAYKDAGKLDQALPLFVEILNLKKAKLGPENWETLGSMQNLAKAYHRAGKLDQALPLFVEILNLNKARLGLDHRETLGSMDDLARAYHGAGKLDQALPLFEETLKLMKARLKPGDPYTLNAMDNLADAYRDAGKLDQALPLYEETLKLRKATLGPDHPDTLASMNNLARKQTHAGKRPEAEATLRQVLAVQRRLLGEENPHTIATLHGLGGNLMAQGRPAEAENIHREALAIQRKASAGKESLAVAGAINTLANVLREQKKLAEAETLLRESLAITKKLQPDGSSEAETLSVLGAVLHLQSRRQEAEAAFNQAELLYNKLLPSSALDKPENLALLERRGEFLGSRGKWKEAAADHAKLIELLPSDHEGYCELAPLLVTMGDLDGYRQLRRRMLTHFADTNDRHTAERIARACMIVPISGTDLDLAAALAERALKLRVTEFTQMCKGLAEFRQGRHASAIEWVQKPLGQVMANHESRDVHSYMILAMAHHQMGQSDQARAALAKGVEFAESNLPRLEDGNLGGSWDIVLGAYALMKEAKALIEGSSETKPSTK